MTIRRTFAAALVLTVTIPVSGAGAEGGDELPQHVGEFAETSDTGYVFDALDLRALEVTFARRFGETFAGMSYDHDRRVATVHHKHGTDISWLHERLAAAEAAPFHEHRLDFVGPAAETAAGGRSAADLTPRTPYRVVTRPEAQSLDELDTERQRFAASELGQYIVFDRVVAEENRVNVTLHALPRSTEGRVADVMSAGGSTIGAVTVEVDPSITERPTRTLRRRDARWPHKSGLRIVGPRGQGCTGGPVVRRPRGTHRLMLTAAHCGAKGSRWTNPNGSFVGNMALRRYPQGGLDSAVLRKPNGPNGFAPRMFGGGPNGRQSHDVRGAVDLLPGAPICSSGASFGDQCNGARVLARNGCVIFDDGKRTCFLDMAEGTGLGPGDSGGPMYLQIAEPRGRLVAGMVIGSGVDADGSRYSFYHPIGVLLDRWNMALLTR